MVDKQSRWRYFYIGAVRWIWQEGTGRRDNDSDTEAGKTTGGEGITTLHKSGEIGGDQDQKEIAFDGSCGRKRGKKSLPEGIGRAGGGGSQTPKPAASENIPASFIHVPKIGCQTRSRGTEVSRWHICLQSAHLQFQTGRQPRVPAAFPGLERTHKGEVRQREINRQCQLSRQQTSKACVLKRSLSNPQASND